MTFKPYERSSQVIWYTFSKALPLISIMAEQPTKNKHLGLKITGGIFAALLIALLVFFLIDYAHYQKDPSPYRTLFVPRLEMSNFEVTELTADKTNMVGRMLIHNPLPFNLRADSLQYKIYISDVEVIKSSYPRSVNIKRWDSTWVDIAVTAYNDKLMTVLKNAEKAGKDSVVYRVQSEFGTNLIFHKHFNIDIDKLLPLIYIPEAKLEKIEWDSLNGEGVNLFIHATVVNKNQFPINFKDLAFKFALADNPWIKGKVPGEIAIPDSSTTPLVLPLRISFKEIGRSIWPLIKNGKNTPFKLEATLKLVSDNNAMRNSKVFFRDAGTIKEIIKLAKDEKQKAKEKKKEAKANGEPEEKKPKQKIKIRKKKK